MGILVLDRNTISGPISLIKAQRVLFAETRAKSWQFQDKVIMVEVGA